MTRRQVNAATLFVGRFVRSLRLSARIARGGWPAGSTLRWRAAATMFSLGGMRALRESMTLDVALADGEPVAGLAAAYANRDPAEAARSRHASRCAEGMEGPLPPIHSTAEQFQMSDGAVSKVCANRPVRLVHNPRDRSNRRGEPR